MTCGGICRLKNKKISFGPNFKSDLNELISDALLPLLIPDSFDSSEYSLCLGRDMLAMPSIVFDSDSERKCLAALLCCMNDGDAPAGRVLDFCVDVDAFKVDSWSS